MTDRRTDPSLQDLNRGMLVAAAALVVAGGVLGATGFALGAAAVVLAGRSWYRLTTDFTAKRSEHCR